MVLSVASVTLIASLGRTMVPPFLWSALHSFLGRVDISLHLPRNRVCRIFLLCLLSFDNWEKSFAVRMLQFAISKTDQATVLSQPSGDAMASKGVVSEARLIGFESLLCHFLAV